MPEEQDGNSVSLRERYRRLKRKTQEQRDDLISFGNPALVNMVRQANEMVSKIHAPQDRLMDADVFESLTHCADIRSRRLSLRQRFKTPLDVVLKVKEKYTLRGQRLTLTRNDSSSDISEEEQSIQIDWTRLGRDVSLLFNSASGMKCMVGFVDVERRVRRQTSAARPRPTKLPTGKAEAPKQRTAREVLESATEMDRILAALKDVLQEEDCKDGILIAELTTDHDSYAQTTMNFFCLSFLVRDGQVSLKPQNDGVLVVPAFHHPHRSENRKRRQLATKMTIEQWQNNCQILPRSKCKMTR